MLPDMKDRKTDEPIRPDVWEWADREVTRQGAPELASEFVQAWDYARNALFPMSDHLDTDREIRFINMLVCGDLMITPGAYPTRYRLTPVVFVNGNEGANWQQIPLLMSNLCKSGLLYGSDEDVRDFIVEFLKIHPFEDGNGRTAAILLNRRIGRLGNSGFAPVPTLDGWVEDARV